LAIKGGGNRGQNEENTSKGEDDLTAKRANEGYLDS
jgi:hypothetical protein